MELRYGNSVWPALAHSKLACEPLAADEQCDVLVVGSGITGALVADALSREGADVVVIDKRRVASGSTPASTALLLYELDTPLLDLAEMRGRHDADSAYAASLGGVNDFRDLLVGEDLDCTFAERKSLFLARPESDVGFLLREANARRTLGIHAEFLGHDELLRHFGIDRPGAILSSPALEINPWEFTTALWKRSCARGVRLYDRTPISPSRWSGANPCITTVAGFHVGCEHLVFATGYEAPELFPDVASQCSLYSTFALATAPVDDTRLWPGRALIWEMGDPYMYLRTTADRRVIIGGADIAFEGELPRDEAIAQSTSDLLVELGSLFPRLRRATADYAWTGVFAKTRDGLPYIGPVEGADRCQFALGYGGNGITFSLVAAQIIRDRICGRPAGPAAKLFGFGRAKL
jgi:glycine/D-amino acid oxidase-like deaminating enzyme